MVKRLRESDEVVHACIKQAQCVAKSTWATNGREAKCALILQVKESSWKITNDNKCPSYRQIPWTEKGHEAEAATN